MGALESEWKNATAKIIRLLFFWGQKNFKEWERKWIVRCVTDFLHVLQTVDKKNLIYFINVYQPVNKTFLN